MTLTVAISRNYWVSGDTDIRTGQGDLIRILEESLNSNAQGNVFTVSLSTENIVTITSLDALDFTILWKDALTTVDPGIWGFDPDVIDQDPHVAPWQSKGVWIPGEPGELLIAGDCGR